MVHAERSGRRLLAGAGCLGFILLAAGYALRHWWMPHPSPVLLLRQAIASIDAGDNAVAAHLLDEILEREPRHDKALLHRGQVARRMGDDRMAARCWAMIPDDHAREGATARFFEGQQALAAYRSRDAERLFRRSTELFPDYAAPREALIFLYQLQMRDTDLWREMIAIRPLRPWTVRELAMSTGWMGKAVSWPSQIVELERLVVADNGDVHSILALAECRYAGDHADEAIELLEKSLAANPAEQALRGLLANILVQRRNLDRAREILGNEQPSGDVSVRLCRAYGAYFSVIGDWSQAAAWLERAVQLDSGHWPTTYEFGQALEHAGRHDEANRVLKRARLMEQVVIERARVLEEVGPQVWHLESGDLDDTQFLEKLAVEIARLLLELGRAFEATAWLEQALAWNPDDARARGLYDLAVGRAPTELDAAVPTVDVPRRATSPAVLPWPPSTRRGNDLQHRPALQLVDRHSQAGVEFQYRNGAAGSKYILETLGGGVAALDFDGDGWPDLYFTQGCPLPVDPHRNETGRDETQRDKTSRDEPWRDRLFQNLNGSFRDVTETAGLGDTQYSQGCSGADFDNDGFVDLAVANFGTNVLYHNNGDGTFTDVTAAAGIVGEHWSTSLAFADLDRDGNLDLYVVTYVLEPYRTCRPDGGHAYVCPPHNFQAEQDLLFHSRGDGTFEDVTTAAGIIADDGKGLGVVVADLDDDGWPDIYVANDSTPNFLFHNQTPQPGASLRFEECGLASGSGVNGRGESQAGMGIACADFDGDRLLDLVVTNYYLQSATFYRNQGSLLFVDATDEARLYRPTQLLLGFGTQAVDVDLDGRLDLFIANGHVDDFRPKDQPWKMPPQLFYNLGEAIFADASRECGEYFQGAYLGRAAARLDWDRDGRLDLAIVHLDRPAALLRNETEAIGGRLILDLHGVESNRDAIGARIALTSGGNTRIHEICGGDGFFASNERRVILGLGSAATVDRLEIRWPGGRIDRWRDLPAETALVVIEGRPPVLRKLLLAKQPARSGRK